MRDVHEIANEAIEAALLHHERTGSECTSALRHFFAAAIEKDRAERWLPIETAPKNGTRILLAGRWKWEGVNPARWIGAPHNGWHKDDGCYFDQPTHWRHLPSPPSEGQP